MQASSKITRFIAILIFMVSLSQCTIPFCARSRIDSSSGKELCLQCEQSYYMDGNDCKRCMSDCLVCYSVDKCSTCDVGYFKNFKDTCTKCSPQCKTCKAQLYCDVCADGYFGQLTCNKCMDNCNKCYFDYKCSECRTGFTKTTNIFSTADTCREGMVFLDPSLMITLLVLAVITTALCVGCMRRGRSTNITIIKTGKGKPKGNGSEQDDQEEKEGEDIVNSLIDEVDSEVIDGEKKKEKVRVGSKPQRNEKSGKTEEEADGARFG